MVPNSRLHIVAKTGKSEINWPHEFKGQSFLVHRVPIFKTGQVAYVLALVLFTSADTVNQLAEKLTVLQSKLKLYEDEIVSLRSTRYTFENIVGISKGMEIVKLEASKAVANQLPVLITGESGTGKELIAQAIHDGSARRLYPFVRINCAAIPRELFESELFGYEKGSFTGAGGKGKPGKFELAHMGTIFLDEIGDLPMELQPKLLRVLELKEFERVGGNRIIHSDFRLVAATNRNLEQMIDEGKFRLDLFFRLNVIPITIPPLRLRKEDILPLAQYFLEQKKKSLDRPLRNIKITKEGSRALRDYDWPGNSRELLNVVERTLASIEGDTIQVTDLPYYIQKVENEDIGKLNNATTLKAFLQNAERKAIKEALARQAGNRNLTADSLGIHRTLLYKKMKALGIEHP
jgi:transcriptional regulator with PAS, ATPase and Fis domain